MLTRYAVLLLTLVVSSVLLLGAIHGSPQLMAPGTLSKIEAGDCLRCCDETGSWNRCPGVPHNCETKDPIYGIGFECEEEDADCTFAPTGNWNGQCESTIFEAGCDYEYNQFCSKFMTGGCYTTVTHIEDPPLTLYNCHCSDGEETTNNNSRTTCYGQLCLL